MSGLATWRNKVSLNVAGRRVPFSPKQFPIRLSKRVGVRTMGSIGGKVPCPSGEQIGNGGFETGDFPPWEHSANVEIWSGVPRTGTYYCIILDFDDWVKQTLSVRVPVKCVTTFEAYVWLSGPVWTNLGKIIVGYTNGTTSEMTIEGIGDYEEQDIKPILVSGRTISYVEFLAITGGTRLDCGGMAVDDVSLIC